MNILDKIINNTREDLERKKSQQSLSEIRKLAELQTAKRLSFAKALQRQETNIIAEVKKASPSKGVICQSFEPVAIAREYQQGGAAAISVLTNERFFQGSIQFLDDIAKAVSLPLLRKDFIIDAYQIYSAKAHSASAILLLVVALNYSQLCDYLALAHELGMDALVEVHNQDELETAVVSGANIIGVNNRDLTTFETSLETSLQLAPNMPAKCICVSESGLRTREDIEQLEKAGFDAFLIGETLMRQKDRPGYLKKLRGV